MFSDTTAAALKFYDPLYSDLENWEGTRNFVLLIWKWSCIINIKYPIKGTNTQNVNVCHASSSNPGILSFFHLWNPG